MEVRYGWDQKILNCPEDVNYQEDLGDKHHFFIFMWLKSEAAIVFLTDIPGRVEGQAGQGLEIPISREKVF